MKMETLCFSKKLVNYRTTGDQLLLSCVRSADIKAIGRSAFNSVVERVTGKYTCGFTEVNLQACMVCLSPTYVKLLYCTIVQNLPQKVDSSSTGQEMPRGSWLI
jgi:hypothetical protein